MGKTRRVRVYKKGGNKPCFDCGGNVFQQGGPPPGGMMQGQPQQQPQQQQQPQMSEEEAQQQQQQQQLMMQVAQMIQQGTKPEDIVKILVKELELEEEQAIGIIKSVVEMIKEQSQQQEQQQPPMEQPPMEQPMMQDGGNPFMPTADQKNFFEKKKETFVKNVVKTSDLATITTDLEELGLSSKQLKKGFQQGGAPSGYIGPTPGIRDVDFRKDDFGYNPNSASQGAYESAYNKELGNDTLATSIRKGVKTLSPFINPKKQGVDKEGNKGYYKNVIPGSDGYGIDTPEGTTWGMDNQGNESSFAPGYNPYIQRGGHIPQAQYGLTHSDSLRHQHNKIVQYEQLQGSKEGNPLSYYNDPKYMDKLMDISDDLTDYNSAMEKAEATDFIFNSGSNPKRQAIQEFYRKNNPELITKDKYGRQSWAERNSMSDDDIDKLYKTTVGSLKENDRRVMNNLGRDWYYKNSGVKNTNYDYGLDDEGKMIKGDYGEWSPAYMNSWYGRIHNTNDFSDFDPKDETLKHPSKRQRGGNIPQMQKGGFMPKRPPGGWFPSRDKLSPHGNYELSSPFRQQIGYPRLFGIKMGSENFRITPIEGSGYSITLQGNTEGTPWLGLKSTQSVDLGSITIDKNNAIKSVDVPQEYKDIAGGIENILIDAAARQKTTGVTDLDYDPLGQYGNKFTGDMAPFNRLPLFNREFTGPGAEILGADYNPKLDITRGYDPETKSSTWPGHYGGPGVTIYGLNEAGLAGFEHTVAQLEGMGITISDYDRVILDNIKADLSGGYTVKNITWEKIGKITDPKVREAITNVASKFSIGQGLGLKKRWARNLTDFGAYGILGGLGYLGADYMWGETDEEKLKREYNEGRKEEIMLKEYTESESDRIERELQERVDIYTQQKHKQLGGHIPKAQWGVSYPGAKPARYYSALEEGDAYNQMQQYADDMGIEEGDISMDPGYFQRKGLFGRKGEWNFGMTGAPGTGAGTYDEYVQDVDPTGQGTGILSQSDWETKNEQTFTPTRTGTVDYKRDRGRERQEKQMYRTDKRAWRKGQKAEHGSAWSNLSGDERANIGIAGLNVLGSIGQGKRNRKAQDEFEDTLVGDSMYRATSADTSGLEGDYLWNAQGSNFRPTDTGMGSFGNYGKVARFGGNVGDEVYMDENELQNFLDGGGLVDYLD